MTKNIINYVIMIIIAVLANYPIYRDLQGSVKVAQATISNVNSVVLEFNNELDSLENDILGAYIRADITKAELISQLDSTLNKIDRIKFETQIINQRLNRMVDDKIEKVIDKKEEELKNILNKQPIPGLPGF
jgi:peptidoglycan hydrolase CwlO-like protein